MLPPPPQARKTDFVGRRRRLTAAAVTTRFDFVALCRVITAFCSFAAMSNVQSITEPDLDSERPLPDYRPVSSLAIAGFLVGCLSPLAYAHCALWLIPWLAVVVNAVALRRIAAESGQMLGRRGALIGLVLGLICGIGAPLQYVIYSHQLRADAINITEQWLKAVRDDKPEVAHQLNMTPISRFPIDDQLIQRYPPDLLDVLHKYAERPAVQLLLKLGKRPRVRYYMNYQVWSDHFGEYVSDDYALTLHQGGQPYTFFVRVSCARVYNPAAATWQWRVSDVEFVSTPNIELQEQLKAGRSPAA